MVCLVCYDHINLTNYSRFENKNINILSGNWKVLKKDFLLLPVHQSHNDHDKMEINCGFAPNMQKVIRT